MVKCHSSTVTRRLGVLVISLRFITGRVVLGLLCAAALWGQTLRVSPTSPDRKGQGSFSIVLESPQDKAPVAMQWEMEVPPAVTITVADVVVGKAAEGAGKSLACADSTNKQRKDDGVRYKCILAGGAKRISSGPIAVVHYQVQAGALHSRIRVAIESVKGVSLDLKSTAIDGTAAIITNR